MKQMFTSVGALAMWWAVGYGIQAAAWVEGKVKGTSGVPEDGATTPPVELEDYRAARRSSPSPLAHVA